METLSTLTEAYKVGLSAPSVTLVTRRGTSPSQASLDP